MEKNMKKYEKIKGNYSCGVINCGPVSFMDKPVISYWTSDFVLPLMELVFFLQMSLTTFFPFILFRDVAFYQLYPNKNGNATSPGLFMRKYDCVVDQNIPSFWFHQFFERMACWQIFDYHTTHNDTILLYTKAWITLYNEIYMPDAHLDTEHGTHNSIPYFARGIYTKIFFLYFHIEKKKSEFSVSF